MSEGTPDPEAAAKAAAELQRLADEAKQKLAQEAIEEQLIKDGEEAIEAARAQMRQEGRG